MSVLRQIDLGDARLLFEKRANALDQIEADAGNILFAQPIQKLPALKGNRQAAHFLDGKIDIV